MEAKAADVQSVSENDIVQRLRQENAALRAELQALRSLTQLQISSSTTRAGHEQTFDFMKLPRELRNLVYELCVVVGNIYIAMPTKFSREDMRCQQPRDAPATTSLFAVNKQVRHEALELYLARNHFIITAFAEPALPVPSDSCPLSQIPGCIEPMILVHLRSMSISLDTPSIRVTDDDDENPIDFHLAHDSVDEVRSIVRHYNRASMDILHDVLETLDRLFTSCMHLRRIQLNVQNMRCVTGYSRFVIVTFSDIRVKRVLRLFAEKAQKVESLDFLGTFSDKERQVIRLAFPKFIRKKVTFHGQFGPYEGDWDPEVEVFDETPSDHDALDSSGDSASEDSASE